MNKHAILITTRDVVTALGGASAVAELTGRKRNAVYNWINGLQKEAPIFPPHTFRKINQALEARGLSADPSLWRMS